MASSSSSYLFETRSCYAAPANPELLSTMDPPASASLAVGTDFSTVPGLSKNIDYLAWFLLFVWPAFVYLLLFLCVAPVVLELAL